MCLVLFAYDPESDLPLVVAANRDEFYARPARSAHFWDDHPTVLAGRDLSAGGTWLGVSRRGRFATVTNFAEEGPSAAPRSRGHLPAAFLTGGDGAHHFAHHLHTASYRGFNLLMWDGSALVYTSNRGHTQGLEPGVYGLANAELGARWPKVVSGCRALADAVAAGADPDVLIALLADRTVPPDHELPRRGRPLDLERRVAPRFIAGAEYGTRASTVVVFRRPKVTGGADGRERGRGGAGNTASVSFVEQEYGPGGSPAGRASYCFELSESSQEA